MSGTLTSLANSANAPATAAANAATGAGTGNAATGLAANFNTFLTLLTTQLKNQDPTKAMDTNEMTAQLVQFASVEQQINMNTNLRSLVDLQQTSQLTAGSALVGQTVEVASDHLSLQSGTAGLRLPAAGAAQTAQIEIVDPFGRTLRRSEVRLGEQPTNWTWNGATDAGRSLPDGSYRFIVSGRDASGSATPLTANVLARATSAQRVTEGGVTELQLDFGALQLPFSAVRSIRSGGS